MTTPERPSEFTTLRSLLEHHVQTLRLRPIAAFPTELENMKEEIKRYQMSQQKVTLESVK
jgi:hypothetical protein